MLRLTTDRIWFLVKHIDCPTYIGPLIGSLRTKAVFTCCQLRSGVLLQSTHSSSSLHLTRKQYGLGWRPQEFFSPPYSIILSFLALWINLCFCLFFVLTKDTYPGVSFQAWRQVQIGCFLMLPVEPRSLLNHFQDFFRLINVLLPLLELHLPTPQLTWQAPIHQASRQ